MSTFNDLFSGYFKGKELPPVVLDGEVRSVNINSQKRIMDIHTEFPQPVGRGVLFDAERALQNPTWRFKSYISTQRSRGALLHRNITRTWCSSSNGSFQA